jgi:hypothetical protein
MHSGRPILGAPIKRLRNEVELTLVRLPSKHYHPHHQLRVEKELLELLSRKQADRLSSLVEFEKQQTSASRKNTELCHTTSRRQEMPSQPGCYLERWKQSAFIHLRFQGNTNKPQSEKRISWSARCALEKPGFGPDVYASLAWLRKGGQPHDRGSGD